VEEALIEIYLAGVSVRPVEDITEGAVGHPARDPSAIARRGRFPRRTIGVEPGCGATALHLGQRVVD